ncbi:MAG: hypothetical protein PHT07_21720 [Paludibacter sp.]|nr:hypothetical protein [Paludibacter sp.]
MEIVNRRYKLITFRLFRKEEWVGYVICEFKNSVDAFEVTIKLTYRVPLINNKWELIENNHTVILNKKFELDEITRAISSSNPRLLGTTFKAETKSWTFNFKSNPEKTIKLKEFLYEPIGFEITDLDTNKYYVFSDCSEDDILQLAFDNFIL